MNNKEKLLLLIALSISLFLNTYKISNGIPSKERANLVLQEAQIKQLSRILKETRDEIYQTKSYIQPFDIKNSMYKVILDGKEVEISKFHINASRSFLIRSLYPDEQLVLVGLSNLNPERLEFNPHLFQYGGMYIYLIGACIKIASLLNLLTLTGDITYYFLHPEEIGKLFVIGRCVGAFFGSFAIIIIYLIGSYLYNKKTGLIAALFLSVMPPSVIYAHQLKPYVFNLPWFLLSFYYICKILKEEKISNYLLAGFFAGISCGILIVYGAIFILIPIAHLLKRKKAIFLFNKDIILSFLLAIIGFIVVNPYIIFSLKEAIYEYRFLAAWHSPNFSFNYPIILSISIGWPLLCACVIGILYAILRREKADILILLFIFPAFFYIAIITSSSIHYGMWMLPFLILLGSRVLTIGLEGKGKYIIKSIILFIFIYTFLYSLAYDKTIFAEKNIKTEAGKWIAENIKEGSSIGFWRQITPFAHPPINVIKYKVSFEKTNIFPEYFVLSENDWIPQGFELFLKTHYSEIKRFEELPNVFRIKFFSHYYYPKFFWWWRTLNPNIIIYKRCY